MINGVNPHKAAGVAPEARSASLQAQHGEPAGAERASGTGGAKANDRRAAELVTRLQEAGNDLSVAVDEGTGVMVVRVTDNQTGEVVKQIPAQEFIDAELNMERIVGLIIDDQA